MACTQDKICSTLLGFGSELIRAYMFEREQDPVLLQMVWLNHLPASVLEVASSEWNNLKRTQKLYERIIDQEEESTMIFLLQILEVVAPETTRQALNAYRGAPPSDRDYSLTQTYCAMCGTVETFRDRLSKDCVLYNVVLETLTTTHIISCDEISKLKHLDVEDRMPALIEALKLDMTMERYHQFLSVVGQYNKELEQAMWSYFRDFHAIGRARRILQWNMPILDGMFKLKSEREDFILNLLDDGFISTEHQIDISRGHTPSERMAIVVNHLTELQTVNDYERIFDHLANYDPDLGRVMRQLLHLYQMGRLFINTKNWSIPLQDMWDYDAMADSTLDETSELRGRGEFREMTSEELVMEWYTRFICGAGGANGVVIEFRKFEYDTKVMWGIDNPPMDKIDRPIYVTVEDSGRQTKEREKKEKNFKTLRFEHHVGLCTQEQYAEFRVVTSIKFDLCLQKVLAGKAGNIHYRSRLQLKTNIPIRPKDTITVALTIYQYADAFDGSEHIYPDGTMFTHDCEWRVRQSLRDLNSSRILAQRVRLNVLLESEPSFLLSPAFQKCLEENSAIIFRKQ